jgi:hypothetical protein
VSQNSPRGADGIRLAESRSGFEPSKPTARFRCRPLNLHCGHQADGSHPDDTCGSYKKLSLDALCWSSLPVRCGHLSPLTLRLSRTVKSWYLKLLRMRKFICSCSHKASALKLTGLADGGNNPRTASDPLSKFPVIMT